MDVEDRHWCKSVRLDRGQIPKKQVKAWGRPASDVGCSLWPQQSTSVSLCRSTHLHSETVA